MQYQSSASSPVAKASRATFLGTATPLDSNFVPSDLSMTVTALPPNGTVLDGFTPVRLGQVLTLAHLGALKFRPALSGAAGSPGFGPPTANPAGAVVGADTGLPAGCAVLSVPQDSGARTIGIQISRRSDSRASGSYAIITGLPSNGVVRLADGMTAVAQGQTLTAAQLKRLRFRPAIDAVGQISNLTYLMIGSAGNLAGCVLLIVRPAAPPLSAAARGAPASVAESSSAGSAGPAARPEARLSFGSASKLIPSVLPSGAEMQARGRSLGGKRTPFSIGSLRRPRNVSASSR